MNKCARCGLDNSFIEHPDLRFCIRCGEKLKISDEFKSKTIELLGPVEVAKILGVTKTTLYQYVHRKQIPYLKVGKCLRFEPESVNNFVKNGGIGGKE